MKASSTDIKVVFQCKTSENIFISWKNKIESKKILQMSFQLYTKSALEVRWLIYMKYIFKHFSSEHSGVTRILFLAPSLSSCWSIRIYPEAPLLLHSSDNDGNTINPIKTDDIVRDLLLDHGFFPLLLHQQTGMAKFHPTQPLTQRLFHQSKIQWNMAKIWLFSWK